MLTVFKDINKEWTLFIDRDGVVNVERPDRYVNQWSEFKFCPGVKKAFRVFNKTFGPIIMITNQRGVARGITKPDDLELIHRNMLLEIMNSGGRLDDIFVCTEMEGINRKPNPGMGNQAQKKYPQIRIGNSIMVGDKLSDMEFGRNLGVKWNVYLNTTRKLHDRHRELIDFVFDDLAGFAAVLPLS